MMQRTAKDNILEQDKRWMTWLKTCSRRPGISGQTLLQEYASAREVWMESLAKLRTEKDDDWFFCRGPLSDVEISTARDRYLSQYVFVAGDNCSQSFVDAMLAAEDAQIRMRLDAAAPVECKHCAAMKHEMALMREALSARQIRTNEDVQLAAVMGVFTRAFICGDSYSTSKREVRTSLERIMRVDFSPHERLPAAGNVWRRFVYDAFRMDWMTNAGLPCRKRQRVITTDGEIADPEEV